MYISIRHRERENESPFSSTTEKYPKAMDLEVEISIWDGGGNERDEGIERK